MKFFLKHLNFFNILLKKMTNVHITCPLQEGEQFVKKIGGVFAFKIKDGPGGKEATWIVDVKNGKGSVAVNAGQCYFCHVTAEDE